jgi:twitching motility protein PilT
MSQEAGALPVSFHQGTGEGVSRVVCPSALTASSSLEEILVFAREAKASDVHVCTGYPVMFRKYGALEAVTQESYAGSTIEVMLEEAVPADKWERVLQAGDLEYVHVIPGAGRFRMVITRQRFGWDVVARVIDKHVRTFEESLMPASCKSLIQWAQGLVLVAGPAGCGKSSTLATLVEMVNQTREDHIITIENPIELIYTPKKCQISQREIGLHTLSAANALRAALREDPDIIVVSELRDLETIQLAVTAAETGHLVFGTMNTNDATQTIISLINSFSPDEQPIVRSMVSESLRGVVCQQLIPRLDGKGVIPAYEVLTMNSAAAALVKSDRMRQLNNVIATGKAAGMVLLDNSLQDLVKQGVISGQEAYKRAITPGIFSAYAPAKPLAGGAANG